MAYGEFTHGIVKDEKNVLFLNLDYGLGMGIMIDQEIYYGKSGFAGEFGHIPLFDNDIICNCGKKGCLETEASGWALVEMFKKEIQNGTTTALDNEAGTPIILENIIKAALNDDVLAIELVAKVGSHLGKAISILINIFNPELVILGGALAETGDYLRLPILSAINKYSLSRVNSDTAIKISNSEIRSGLSAPACSSVTGSYPFRKAGLTYRSAGPTERHASTVFRCISNFINPSCIIVGKTSSRALSKDLYGQQEMFRPCPP